jgi:hypothetical protein
VIQALASSMQEFDLLYEALAKWRQFII